MSPHAENSVGRRPSHWRMLITPWTWRWQTWVTVVLLWLAAYFLSAVPMIRWERQVVRSWRVLQVVEFVYQPVWICKRNSEALHAVIRFEHWILDRILGGEYRQVYLYTASSEDGPLIDLEIKLEKVEY